MHRPILMALATLATASAHADGSCQPLVDSLTKYLNTPSHLTTTTTRGGKQEQGETINAGSKRYLRVGGKWRVSPMTGEQMLELAKENAKASTCRVLREESVGGEAAIVYEAKRNDDEAVSTSENYISKRSGLPLRTELTVEGMHMSSRYEYTNVQAPPLGP